MGEELSAMNRRGYLRKYKAEWYQRNKARILAHRKGNPEVQAYYRAYYAKNKARLKEMRKRWRITVRPKEYFKEWRRRNRSDYLAKGRARYASNPHKYCLASSLRHQLGRDELRDCYVRKILSFRTCIKPSEWPADLVELKRAQLKLHRYVKTNQHH